MIVVASYRQTCAAYPNGGGAYAVSRANLGENASLDRGLGAADRLRADGRGVGRGRRRGDHQRGAGAGAARGRAVARLRRRAHGRRTCAASRSPGAPSPSRPTASSSAISRCSRSASRRSPFGDGLTAESAGYELRDVDRDRRRCSPSSCVLRAFASGCTALTGVEAVSNGVPAFEPPKSRNAAATLVIMGAAGDHDVRRDHGARDAAHVHMAEDPANLIGFPPAPSSGRRSARSGSPTFGETRAVLPAAGFTAAILILAANTAFNGFPVLSSLLGRDNYLPAPARQPRRPARVLERDRPAALVAGAADRRLQRRASPA